MEGGSEDGNGTLRHDCGVWWLFGLV
jgi:hypothetical protein